MSVQKELLLSVQDLHAVFDTGDGQVRAVDGVSFDIHRGDVFSIVGESGSGKSVTAMTILGLIPTVKVPVGKIMWKGRDLLEASEAEMRQIRGAEIAMIFQDPLTALNPVHTVGPPDRRDGADPRRLVEEGRRSTGRSTCWASSASRNRGHGRTCTRTSSRAVCASGR